MPSFMPLATRVLIIKHTPVRVLGWLVVSFCVFAAVGAWRAGARGPSLFFLIFGALGVYFILGSGAMHVDSDSIKYHLPLRGYQIKWNEVRYIEMDRQGGNIVFAGENKRLAMIGPAFWSGKDKSDVHKLIGQQLATYNIDVRLTEKAMIRLSKNTRINP